MKPFIVEVPLAMIGPSRKRTKKAVGLNLFLSENTLFYIIQNQKDEIVSESSVKEYRIA